MNNKEMPNISLHRIRLAACEARRRAPIRVLQGRGLNGSAHLARLDFATQCLARPCGVDEVKSGMRNERQGGSFCPAASLLLPVFGSWYLAGISFLLKYFAVMPEEEYLVGKFGKEYLDYKLSVRRWI